MLQINQIDDNGKTVLCHCSLSGIGLSLGGKLTASLDHCPLTEEDLAESNLKFFGFVYI
jgi:hypothetical protein